MEPSAFQIPSSPVCSQPIPSHAFREAEWSLKYAGLTHGPRTHTWPLGTTIPAIPLSKCPRKMLCFANVSAFEGYVALTWGPARLGRLGSACYD